MKSPAAERPIAPATSQMSILRACPVIAIRPATRQDGDNAAGELQPIRCSAVLTSSRRSSSTSRAPSSPPAASPQTGTRPASTARAPRASAVDDVRAAPDAAVEEHLDPVSDRVDDRGQRLEGRHRRRRAGGRRGSRRRCPPRRARLRVRRPRASSTPLTTTGTGVEETSSSRYAQSREGSMIASASFSVPAAIARRTAGSESSGRSSRCAARDRGRRPRRGRR